MTSDLIVSQLSQYMETALSLIQHVTGASFNKVAWPSGLRRWFKAPVSSEAWVRIPPLPMNLFHFSMRKLLKHNKLPSFCFNMFEFS